jgi:hypothetical protein
LCPSYGSGFSDRIGDYNYFYLTWSILLALQLETLVLPCCNAHNESLCSALLAVLFDMFMAWAHGNFRGPHRFHAATASYWSTWSINMYKLKIGLFFSKVYLNKIPPEISLFPCRCWQLSIQILVCRLYFLIGLPYLKGELPQFFYITEGLFGIIGLFLPVIWKFSVLNTFDLFFSNFLFILV